MIEACWCEQHDLFYWESLNSQAVTLPETDPVLAHTLAAYSYCMRTNFFDNLSDRFVQGPNVSLSVQRPEWHKLLLIKFLTIHGKWVFSVNTAPVGANGACWGLLGNKASSPPPIWVNIWRKHEVKTWRAQAERAGSRSAAGWAAVLQKSYQCFRRFRNSPFGYVLLVFIFK